MKNHLSPHQHYPHKSLNLKCRGRESNPYDPCGSQDFKSDLYPRTIGHNRTKTGSYQWFTPQEPIPFPCVFSDPRLIVWTKFGQGEKPVLPAVICPAQRTEGPERPCKSLQLSTFETRFVRTLSKRCSTSTLVFGVCYLAHSRTRHCQIPIRFLGPWGRHHRVVLARILGESGRQRRLPQGSIRFVLPVPLWRSGNRTSLGKGAWAIADCGAS